MEKLRRIIESQLWCCGWWVVFVVCGVTVTLNQVHDTIICQSQLDNLITFQVVLICSAHFFDLFSSAKEWEIIFFTNTGSSSNSSPRCHWTCNLIVLKFHLKSDTLRKNHLPGSLDNKPIWVTSPSKIRRTCTTLWEKVKIMTIYGSSSASNPPPIPPPLGQFNWNVNNSS